MSLHNPQADQGEATDELDADPRAHAAVWDPLGLKRRQPAV